MNIIIYNLIQIIIFPIFIIFIIIRLVLKKENLKSIFQKFSINNGKVLEFDYIFHVASIGELNSISFILDYLGSSKKILITCSTITSYHLATNRKKNYQVKFLPYDFYPLVKLFLFKHKTKKFIWIDSEIWPNYLFALKINKIKIYLLNARMSSKSFNRWKIISRFIRDMGSKYRFIYASSLENKKKYEILFNRNIEYFENTKFYEKLNIKKKTNKVLCFASIHLEEYIDIIKIISKLNLNNYLKIYLIPRHTQYYSQLKKELKKNNLLINKIFIINKIGKNKEIFNISKIAFMGGSLFNHGGQNPLEALACGTYVLTGPFVNNFTEIYKNLNKKKFCGVFKQIDHNLIAKSIDEKMSKNKLLETNEIKKFFNEKNKKLNLLCESVAND